jgi:hypothetical protein
MRRAGLALVLIAGCASGGANHDLGITVLETVTPTPYGGVQAVTLIGAHMLRVQIENRSHQEIVVHSIKIEPPGPDLYSDDPSQSIEELIGPGVTRTYDMYLTVSTSSRTRSTTSQMLDSVTVDVVGTGSESGNFIAGGSYSVTHVALGS